jgi:small nuclear ribonucleoprotein (snRNP)-like protein
MNKYQKALFNAIDTLINKKIEALKFNRCVEGKVVAVNGHMYTVLINDQTYDIKALNGTYTINDLVLVLIINNDSSKKYILCERP